MHENGQRHMEGIDISEAPRRALERYRAIWEAKREENGYYPNESRSGR